jgi:hypothetical protein
LIVSPAHRRGISLYIFVDSILATNNKQKGKSMETLGYIYIIILYVFKKKISVEAPLEMIRAKLLEDEKETKQGHNAA